MVDSWGKQKLENELLIIFDGEKNGTYVTTKNLLKPQHSVKKNASSPPRLLPKQMQSAFAAWLRKTRPGAQSRSVNTDARS